MSLADALSLIFLIGFNGIIWTHNVLLILEFAK